MLSINTNLSSLIAQNSMKSSSFKLDTAIERMTTGYKINHAKDNAANYSIATNMTTKIGAYMVAEDNVLQGLDMVSTASQNLSLIDDKLQRLRALAVQSSSGSYGEQSLKAINAEANALVNEINRTYSTSEYNGQKVFKNMAPPEIPDGIGTTGDVGVQTPTSFSMRATYSLRTVDYGEFIDNPYTYTDEDIADMKTITQAISESSLVSGGEYSISSVDELVALADYVNAGNDTTGMTFVLGADIDLSSIANWTPIGDYVTNTSYQFKGTFDGNGHVISNLSFNNFKNYQGLFGYIASGSSIKNVALEEFNIKGRNNVGGLVGHSDSSISNCYATGNVTGANQVGGLVGNSKSSISNCYATGTVKGNDSVGGLAGYSTSTTNCYATGNVTGSIQVGGLVGLATNVISNCYATGNVTGSDQVGGLSGMTTGTISNTYATGTVNGSSKVGGLVGEASTRSISNSSATGNVTGSDSVGGLVGVTSVSISNSYATGNVTGTGNSIGGLLGQVNKTSGTLNITNCLSYSTVSGSDSNSTGGLIGGAILTTDNSTFGTINLTGCQSMAQGVNTIGGTYMYDNTTYTLLSDYDMGSMNSGVSLYTPEVTSLTLQVGANAPNSNQITFDMAFMLENVDDLRQIGLNTTSDSLALCDRLITMVNEKQTLYGAVENRLMSVLDEITIQYENLVSSRSTIRDADIAEDSSHYIQQQILQQASATLLSTANQAPSIALQLI